MIPQYWFNKTKQHTHTTEDPATPGPLKRNDPGTITIPQYQINKTKQHTHTRGSPWTITIPHYWLNQTKQHTLGTHWADFVVIGGQLCLTMTTILPCVALSFKNRSILRIIADYWWPLKWSVICIWVWLLWASSNQVWHFELNIDFLILFDFSCFYYWKQ